MVIDATHQTFTPKPGQIAAWSDRHRGIGFDQCLVLEASKDPNIDFFYRIFNANGQEVGQCGNGARCLARFIHYRGLSQKTQLSVQTKSTVMRLTLHQDETVSVEFPCPKQDPKAIPLATDQRADWYHLKLNEQEYRFHALSLGNPHAILEVQDLSQAPVSSLGRDLSTHEFFPQEANISFMQIVTPQHILLRVYERSCGETQACGSAAVAAVAAGCLFHQLATEVLVTLPGGDLSVTWPSRTQAISLRGPACFVYQGQIEEPH